MEDKTLPEVNIGMIGHIDHGKTTLLKALTGVWADVHSEEQKRGITIKLGYADASFYSCECGNFYANSEKCPKCGKIGKLMRTVSFIDAPGHETLMATMLSGAALMNGAILVITVNEKCPQPQTKEHLLALQVLGIKNIIIVQNKIDLVSEEAALQNYEDIKNFTKGTIAENAPIIPVSGQHGINIDVIIHAIQTLVPTPERKEEKCAKMIVIRSFDINKPGAPAEKLLGGVLGGSILRGVLRKGDEIEIRPGIDGKTIKTKILSLNKGKEVEEAGEGGLVSVQTSLDPLLTKADKMSGMIVGKNLPENKMILCVESHLINTIVGTKKEINLSVCINDNLVVIAGAQKSVGYVTEIGKHMKINLKIPICVEKDEKVALSKQVEGRWRLIGWGIVQ